MTGAIPGTLIPLSSKTFELIEKSPSRRVLEVMYGLQILSSYPNAYVAAEHDIVYAGPNDPTSVITPTDRMDLEKLGWHIDREANVYARFV